MRKQTDTREKLLCTAMSLIWQSNYTSVGVNEICKQAGVTKGSFYHYFETKADLYYAAVLHAWEQTKKELEALFTSGLTPLEQLDALIGLIVGHAQVKEGDCSAASNQKVVGCPVFTSGGQCGCDEDKVRLVAQEMTEHKIAYDIRLIQGLKDAGLLNGDPDVSQLARLMYQYVQGLLIYGRIYNDIERVKADLRDGVHRLIDLKQEYRTAVAPVRSEVA
uniref:TetR/AcrR family transcriptional regulator n=1 Tax=Marinobacterium profundum TaxID=1714300 RepID=UPI00082B9352|nr:TetR/AcrR family transcriptional regulator [Marinobacterium profundum]